MASPNEWTWVDPQTIVEPESKSLDGVHITLMMSPYDLPEAVRGFYNSTRERFLIQFKYLSDEPTKAERMGELVSLTLGEKSGRIYEIELDVAKAEAQFVGLMIKAIDELAHTPHRPTRPDNYAAAKNLLSQFGPKLVETAQASL